MKKNITDFPGYMVDLNGVVYSKKTGKQMSNIVDSGGRVRVRLSKDGKIYKRAVSRLVAQEFVPNPENKPQVDHIDGNRSNNNATNLRWCTNEENQGYDNRYNNVLNKNKRVMYGNVEYDSIGELARTLSLERGSKFDTVRKEIQRARYGSSILYGKECRFI